MVEPTIEQQDSNPTSNETSDQNESVSNNQQDSEDFVELSGNTLALINADREAISQNGSDNEDEDESDDEDKIEGSQWKKVLSAMNVLGEDKPTRVRSLRS